MSFHHKRHGLDGTRWRRLRLAILNRANWRCRRCGRYGNEVDHITPLHKGGDPWAESNLQVLCVACHKVKSSEEYSSPDPERKAWADYLRKIAH